MRLLREINNFESANRDDSIKENPSEYIINALKDYIENQEKKFEILTNDKFLNICKRHQILALFKENQGSSSDNYSKLFKARYLFYQNQLRLIIELFNKNNISFFIFKGLALADSIYKKPYHRYFKDLDIFIDKAEYKNALKLLKNIGFSFKNNLNILEQISLRDKTYFKEGILLIKNSILLDLHQIPDFINNKHLIYINSTFKDETISYQTPDIHLNLILLCEHARKHLWAKLIWLVDISIIVGKLNNENFLEIEKLAKKNNSFRAFKISLLLIKNIFGVDNLNNNLEISLSEKLITSYLKKNIFNESNTIKRKLINIILNIYLEDSWINSFNYIIKRTFSKFFKKIYILRNY